MPQTRRSAVLAMSLIAVVGSALTACDSGTVPASPPAESSDSQPTSSQPTSEAATPLDPNNNDQAGGVTAEEAGKIATDKYDGTVKEVESDDYKGTEAWEVEVRDSAEGRIEVKVERSTGVILHMEHDD